MYGDEVEISDYVKNLPSVLTRSIDSTDFSVGIYTFNDIQISCENASGFLGDQNDTRSMFPFSRDRARVRIVLDQGEDEPPTRYNGLINDEASRVDSDNDEITFSILGPDSILKNSEIPAGSISDGMLVSQALVAILNTSDVRSVLGVSLSNLNPSNDITIDLGAKFDKMKKRDALEELLAKSNSILIIDEDLNIIVRDRTHSVVRPILYLYAKGDKYGRENIKSITGHNDGLHRTFNSVLVKGGQGSASVVDTSVVTQSVATTAAVGSARNLTSQNLYGVRAKDDLGCEWVTDEATLDLIAEGYVAEFAYPKMEFQVTVKTHVVTGYDLLDQVSVNFPLVNRPAGKFLPVIGITKIGDTDSPLPYTKGSITIEATWGFKIIEWTEDIENFETTLKLRRVGVSLTDGVLVETSARTIFEMANNTGPADVTGLIFDKTIWRAANIDADSRRVTDTASSEVRCRHLLTALYNEDTDTWTISDETHGDDDGVTFTIVAGTGQVQYTADNRAGGGNVDNLYYTVERISV